MPGFIGHNLAVPVLASIRRPSRVVKEFGMARPEQRSMLSSQVHHDRHEIEVWLSCISAVKSDSSPGRGDRLRLN